MLASVFGGQFYWGVVKNRVKSGVRQTTHSERTAIAIANLIRYSESRENFMGKQLRSYFGLLNVCRVKFSVESVDFTKVDQHELKNEFFRRSFPY